MSINVGVKYTPFKLAGRNNSIVDVTTRHIRHGRKGDCAKCPVALALTERFPNQRVSVDGEDIVIGTTNYHVSRSVNRFIGKFDGQGASSVKPFSFKLTRL